MDFCKTVKTPLQLALAITTLLTPGFKAIADELLLKDGSRLLGTIVKQDQKGILEFKTSYAGVIKIKSIEVLEIKSDEPMTLLLTNGETLQVSNASNTQQGVTIVEESGETNTFPLDELAFVNPEPWRLGEGWKWTGTVSTEINRERGNSDKDEYEADFSTTFRRIDERVTLKGDYDREENNDELTDDDWRLNGRYDRFVNEKFFYGLNTGLEHDRFADLSLRTIIGPEAGYEFIESKATNLGIAGGPMYVREEFYDADDNEYTAFGWQFNYDHFLIPNKVQFYHRHSGLLSMENTENFVWDAWTGFHFPIYAGIFASTELLIEYDGGVEGDVDNTDTTINVKLGYEW